MSWVRVPSATPLFKLTEKNPVSFLFFGPYMDTTGLTRKKRCAGAYLAAAFAALLCLAGISGCGSHKSRRNVEIQKDTVYPLGFLTDTLDVIDGDVASGEYFGSLMLKLGMESNDAYALVQACEGVFDVRKLRAGNNYEAYYTRDSIPRLHYMVYHNNSLDATVFRCFDSLAVWRVTKPIEKVRKSVDVTISSSLWNDMVAQGASPLVILKLSDIYAWTVDFFGLQKGDRFRMIYDEMICEDRVIDVDTVWFALCNHGGAEYPAIMLNQGDGGNLYWNEKGESMRKAFLKAPLNFSRISSGYSTHRRHPITRKVQPHLAVDYAAPAGTPVWSIGEGTVISAGYKGAAGNMVKIRHNSTYTTAYLHLSRFAQGIKQGAHVQQGQVIGYVGSTGRSTGPHLDFRVWKNGSNINPLKLESPPSEPLKAENMPQLDSLYRHYMEIMQE